MLATVDLSVISTIAETTGLMVMGMAGAFLGIKFASWMVKKSFKWFS